MLNPVEVSGTCVMAKRGWMSPPAPQDSLGLSRTSPAAPLKHGLEEELKVQQRMEKARSDCMCKSSSHPYVFPDEKVQARLLQPI